MGIYPDVERIEGRHLLDAILRIHDDHFVPLWGWVCECGAEGAKAHPWPWSAVEGWQKHKEEADGKRNGR